MQRTLADVAREIGGRVVGDDQLIVSGVAGIKEASSTDLTFLANKKYIPLAAGTRACAILVEHGVFVEGKNLIQTDNPSLAFSRVMGLFKEDAIARLSGIHSSAVVAGDALVHPEAAVGPCAVIESGAQIGRGSQIGAGVYVGHRTVVGQDCLIYPNVTLREGVTLGNNVIIHSGTVVGSDGFGYVQVDDRHVKIPQIGGVEIGDDVEIGACVTIDRARFDQTRIGRGSKIDNLVQIAHNVQIEENALIIALAGIAGSAHIGRNAIIAGQVGVAGHTKVGERAVVAAQSGITKDVDPGAKMFGTPAEEYAVATRIMAHTKRLPRYAEEIKLLKAQVAALEKKVGDRL
jgi:UDP-3-O-[3-hydroxymyristoyl] glucosamine N-acyltransferase